MWESWASRLVEGNIRRLEELKDITVAFYDNDMALEVDVKRVSVNLENLMVQHDNAKAMLVQQYNMLKYILDYPADADIAVEHATMDIQDMAELSGLNENLYELQMLRQQQTLAEKQQKLVRDGYLPTLSLTGTWAYTAYTDKFKNWFHSGESNHDFNLKYLFTHGDSLNFQAKFTPTIFTWFWNSNMDINAEGNPLWANGTQDKRQRRNSFSPSLDLYFDRKLPGGHEIMLNAVGTLFHNKQHVHNIQNDETQQTLDDDMRQHNNKYSFIGEAAYTKDWGRTQLALGYRAALAKSDYRITNILSDYKEYDYNATDNKHLTSL